MAVSLQPNVAQTLPQQVAVKIDALPLRAGEVVEARVVTSGQGGSAQLAIGNTVVDAALQVKLQEGALVRLLVQGASPNIRLTVLPNASQSAGSQASAQTPPQTAAQQSLPAQPQANIASQPGAQVSQPQTIPQSQGSAQPQSQGSAQPVSAPVANASSQSSPATAPTPVQANTSNQVPLPSASSTARPASIPVQQTSVPVTQTSNARPVLVSGGTAATGNAIPSTTAQQLPPGTVLRIQTQGAGLQARPVLVPAQEGDTPRSAPQAQAQPLQNATVAIANPVQQAISHTVQGSVFRQDSVAALLTTLAGLGGKIAELPRPVAQAGAELLNGRLNLDAKLLDGPVLKQALQRSGVLLESLLGKGAPVPQGDLKSGLLKLASALRAFVGDGANSKAEAINRPPPPTPGATPRAGQISNGAPQLDIPPREMAARLLGQAEAALSRMRLTQLFSLPDAAVRGGQASGPAAELNMELPLLLGGQLSVGQFQILRDGGNGSGRERDGSWKMKFSINFSQTGEVGATVTLRVKKIGVMLWAEREDMAEALEEMSDELEQVLIARGLEPGSIRVRQGPPPPAKRAIGAYMDDWS